MAIDGGIDPERRRKRARLVPDGCGVGNYPSAGRAIGDDPRERVTSTLGSHHTNSCWLRRILGLSLLGWMGGNARSSPIRSSSTVTIANRVWSTRQLGQPDSQ